MKKVSTLTETARKIYAEALSSCSVEAAIRAKTRVRGSLITLHGAADEVPVEIDLAGVRQVVVIATGKAASAMLNTLLRILPIPEDCQLSGVLIAPSLPASLDTHIKFFAGGHPLPTNTSFAGAHAVLECVRETSTHIAEKPAACFFLLSGGASAMMELPLDPNITLEDTVGFYQALVLSGAPIDEMNCVRKHFSTVKGGRLGVAAAGIPNVTLAVSDVPRGRLHVLASGPTLPDPSTSAECREIIARYGLLQQFPARVCKFFEGDFPETPNPQALKAQAVTLLSDRDLAQAAKGAAEKLGYTAVIDDTCDNCDYERAANYLLGRLRKLHAQYGNVCLIAPGECVVAVPSDAHGKGGRNLHFALYAATLLNPEERSIAILSAGTDGIDGNSQFAGAVVDDNSAFDKNAAQIALRAFDSGTFLSKLGATIETGPSGNNLRDLRLLLAE